MTRRKIATAKRFFTKVKKTSRCWIWNGARNGKGYGNFNTGRNGTKLAHRFSYELTNGPISEGLFILHRCDNPSCVNPKHLAVGTNTDNMVDAARKGRLYVAAGWRNPKLTPNLIRKIFKLHAEGRSQRLIGLEAGCHQSTVSRVVAKKIWKFI